MERAALTIGCGAGFSGDRADAAIPVVDTLAARGGPACLMYETLAERTLAVGPVMAHFEVAADDWERLGRATMAGHLLECGAQVTGGYFADPGYKDVAGLENVGFPVAEIRSDGSCVIGKADRTGGA